MFLRHPAPMPSATPPFDRAIALACTMATLRGRWLYVRCACQHLSSLPIRLMLDRPAVRARSLADVVVRLRCDACRARPLSVYLTEAPYPPGVRGDVMPGWQLLLHGVEAEPNA